MAYPDLPPSPTFWRCTRCDNEKLFRADGIGRIECGRCGAVATEGELLAAHARAHADSQAGATSAH